MSTAKHHILSVSMCLKIFLILLFFTVITVLAAQVDLGAINFTIAMLIATIKAACVVFFFMGLKYDSNENRTIFFSSFIFVAIFIVLTYSDVLFRKEGAYVPQKDVAGARVQDEKS